jgi:membrane-bound inhibitor of C-type lysozyme
VKKIIVLLLPLLIVIGAGWWLFSRKLKTPTLSVKPQPAATAYYQCNGNKSITAIFYKGTPQPVLPGQPPIPTGSVEVKLSDGRDLSLKQTISADGGRYANPDESFIFWVKGNGTLVLENNSEKNYIGCLVVAPDPGDLPGVYADGAVGFSIRYPADYILNTAYIYQSLGPGKDIRGVKFTIPTNKTNDTNLSSYDTGVSVEILPGAKNCNAGLFLADATNIQIISETGRKYSLGTMVQGAAGNRYEEDVWALLDTNPCLAIRYLIHYTNSENYPTGQVTEFDKTGLLQQFDRIRLTLITL